MWIGNIPRIRAQFTLVGFCAQVLPFSVMASGLSVEYPVMDTQFRRCDTHGLGTAKTHKITKKKDQKRWSDVSCPQQRSLQATQVCFPATADSAQFCLLCCQPGPIPVSLAARTSQLTPWCPCRLSAWPGQTIHMANRTC